MLGAGALGLTVALRLAQAGRIVTVFEREEGPGGLAAGFLPAPGVTLEKFYHHLFRSDHAFERLLSELGLGERLQWHQPVTASWINGRAWRLDSPAALLRFRPLPLFDRLRMGLVIAALRLLPRPGPLEGKRAEPWLRKMMGEQAYTMIWAPLLVGKFGAAAGSIALPWFWARVHDRSEDLGYPIGGFQPFYDQLSAAIAEAGGHLRFEAEVKEIRSLADGGLEVSWLDAGHVLQTEYFDEVASTLPTRLTARLSPQLPLSWREQYEWGQAYGVRCLILALDRPLTNVYWLNLDDPALPFLVMVEHTNLRPVLEYGGRHFVYLATYRPMDDPLLMAPTADLLEAAKHFLPRFAPAFEPDWILEHWSFVAPFAQPLVTTEYAAHIPPFETPLPGLWLASMFQVYPHDRGQNYSIELGERLAKRILAEPDK